MSRQASPPACCTPHHMHQATATLATGKLFVAAWAGRVTPYTETEVSEQAPLQAQLHCFCAWSLQMLVLTVHVSKVYGTAWEQTPTHYTASIIASIISTIPDADICFACRQDLWRSLGRKTHPLHRDRHKQASSIASTAALVLHLPTGAAVRSCASLPAAVTDSGTHRLG